MMMPALLNAIGSSSAASALGVLAARATIILAAAAVATFAMRRASAATRHLVWSGAFAGVLVLPFLGALLPAWQLLPAAAPVEAHALPRAHVPSAPAPSAEIEAPATVARAGSPGVEVRVGRATAVPPRLADSRAGERTIESDFVVSTAIAGDAAASTPRESPASPPPSVTRPAVVVVVWFGVMVLLLARLVIGTLTLRRLVRRTLPIADARTRTLAWRLEVQLGVRRTVHLLADPRATVPMTWGIAAPVVVLPAESEEWHDDRLRLVLAHELAHVARLDGATQLVAQLAATIFWFHPLAWLALRAMRRERERACDDLVLATGARASDYARDLVELATRLVPGPATAAAFGMARRSELEGRVRAILDPRLARGRAGGRAASLAISGAMILTVAAATVARRDASAASVRSPSHVLHLVAHEDADDAASASPMPDDSAESPAAEPMSDGDAAVSAPPVEAAEPAVTPPMTTVVAPGGAATADTEPAAPAPPADRATLLMVADAAKRISSDAEKSTLLQAVYPRYRTDDGLRAAYLGVVATLSGDNARAEALVRMTTHDTLSAPVLVQAIAIAAATSADYEQGRALQSIAAQPSLSDPRAHRAFFDATTRMSSSSSEGGVLAAVLRRSTLVEADLVSTMQAAATMSSTPDAANVLVAVVRRHPLDSDALRAAFVAAAGKLGSDTEYRRVMTAAAISY